MKQWFSTGVPPISELNRYLSANSVRGVAKLLKKLWKGSANKKRLRNTVIYNHERTTDLKVWLKVFNEFRGRVKAEHFKVDKHF